jgi:hypothetical protein
MVSLGGWVWVLGLKGFAREQCVSDVVKGRVELIGLWSSDWEVFRVSLSRLKGWYNW